MIATFSHIHKIQCAGWSIDAMERDENRTGEIVRTHSFSKHVENVLRFWMLHHLKVMHHCALADVQEEKHMINWKYTHYWKDKICLETWNTIRSVREITAETKNRLQIALKMQECLPELCRATSVVPKTVCNMHKLTSGRRQKISACRRQIVRFLFPPRPRIRGGRGGWPKKATVETGRSFLFKFRILMTIF